MMNAVMYFKAHCTYICIISVNLTSFKSTKVLMDLLMCRCRISMLCDDSEGNINESVSESEEG